MKRVNVHEAKTHLSKLIAGLEKDGVPILICRNGKPVAEIGRYKKPVNRLKIHPKLSKIKINYDPTEPLSEDEWPKGSR